MLIRYGYDFTLNCPQETPMICMVSARPEHDRDMAEAETHLADPEVDGHTYIDAFGNRCWRFIAPAGELKLTGRGLIRASEKPDPVVAEARELTVPELPDHVLQYLLGSRYCETDLLMQVAWDLFGGLRPGWNRVQAIVDFVHRHIGFCYTDARSTRTAWQAWEERRGVCRDFAHLAITFCRCLNIPARYVNGHLGDIGIPFNPDPMDYAAWMEVFLGGQWHAFDPRNNARRIGRIVVARGRDAADVPLVHSFGPHWLSNFKVITEEVEAGAFQPAAAWPVAARAAV